MNAAAHCDSILTDKRSLPGEKRGRDRWSSFLSFVQRKLWMNGFDCAFYHSTSCPKRVCRDPLFWLSSYSRVFGTRLSALLFNLLHPWRIYFNIIKIVCSLSDHAVPLIWTFHWILWRSFNGIAVHVLFILILFSVGRWISFRCDSVPILYIDFLGIFTQHLLQERSYLRLTFVMSPSQLKCTWGVIRISNLEHQHDQWTSVLC